MRKGEGEESRWGENSGKKDWEEKRSEEKRKTVTERVRDRGRKEKWKDRR